jgi:hypothetical protein
MKADIEPKSDAMKLLRRRLGLVESEESLTSILRGPFDYTRSRQEQWSDSTVADLAEKTRRLRPDSP